MSLRKPIEDAATANSVAIAHQGSDLNALDELNADLSAGVVYQGSDLNYLELILAAIPVTPSILCSLISPYTLAQNDGMLEGYTNWPYFDGVTPEVGFIVDEPPETYQGVFAAIPANFLTGGGRVPVGDGLMAVAELAMDLPGQPTGGIVYLALVASTPDQSAVAQVQLLRNNAHQAQVGATNGLDSVTVDLGAGADPLEDYRLAMYVTPAGAVGYAINGVDQGTLAGTPFAGKTDVVFVVQGGNSSNGFMSGTVRARLITSVPAMLFEPDCVVAS